MSKSAFDFRATTAWMQTLIRQAGTQSPLREAAAQIDALLVSSERFPASERLAIYQRAYRFRLLECLQAQYPVLLHFLETELFNQFAFDYLDAYPSQNYSLQQLGAHFARHLAATRPDRELPLAEREDWPDFIIALAQLERAFYEIYDGPGAEKDILLRPEQIPELGEDRNIQLSPIPCLRVYHFPYPVQHYFREVRYQRDPHIPLPSPTFVVLSRKDYIVRIYDISEAQYRLLRELLNGHSLTESMQLSKTTAFVTYRWLQEWVQQGWFLAAQEEKSATL